MKSGIRWLAIATILAGGAELTGAADAPPSGIAIPDTLFGDAAAPAPDTVVAVVEGKKLLQGEIDELVNRALAMNADRIPAEQMNEARATISARAREELIVQMVLEHEADKRSIVVSSEEVEKTKKSLPLPPGQTLEQALAEQSVPMERLEADLTRALKIRALLDRTVPEAEATDAKVKEYYDKNPERFSVREQATARHILIRVPEGCTDAEKAERKAKAEDIRKELIDGGDFATLAREHSEDPGSKDRGGVYTFSRGQMVKPFEDAAFDRDIDVIGPLVETQFGFHIVQTMKRDPARKVSLEEVGPMIRDMIKGEGRQQAIQAYVRELRQKANVVLPGAPAQ